MLKQQFETVRILEAAPSIDSVDVTVIVPVVERPAMLSELYAEYAAPLRASGRSFEFIFAADLTRVNSLASVRELAATDDRIRFFQSSRSIGETGLIRQALTTARGDIVLMLPAYHRVEANVLDELLRRVEAGADYAVAWRWPRRDAWVNRVQNSLLHMVVGTLATGRIHDVGCGVGAVRRSVLGAIPLYGDVARFLPLVALHQGYVVEEVPAQQHTLDKAGRIYRPGIYLRRVVDILGLFFLLRFTEKPLRFFGLIGAPMSLFGAGWLALLVIQRLAGQPLAGRPALLLAVLFFTIGIQVIGLGLIGEIIVHVTSSGRRVYRLREATPRT